MALAVDPTYPLYPVAALLAAVMLFLVLLTNLIRQSWNLGIAFLCFWLFLDNITVAVNAIIWSDNHDVKLYVYCDIVSHLQLLCYIVRPITTLLVTRRLYLIARLQSVELPSKSARRRNLFIEWTLGLVVPVLVAGPIYYTVQAYRFEEIEGFGCTNAIINRGLPLILIDSWYVIPPLISITIYCPLVVRIFYRHTREVNRFLRSNSSVSRTNYIRILALASVDIVFTLPVGIVNLILDIQQSGRAGHSLTLYTSWAQVHSNWDPVGIPYSWILGTYLADQYVYNWTAPVLAFAIFGIFGLTTEARTSYWRVICVVGGWFGWKPTLRTKGALPPMDTIDFSVPPQDMSFDAETRSHPSSASCNYPVTDHDSHKGESVVFKEQEKPEEGRSATSEIVYVVDANAQNGI